MSARDLLCDLREVLDESRYGGKAASLARLIRADLPVPDGFAIAREASAAIMAGEVEFGEELKRRFDALRGPVAVRSSAVGEDSEEASFAGQHETVLGVSTFDALIHALRCVVRSGHAEHVTQYREAVGVESVVSMGIVVQRMIDASYAGVMFTRNPRDGTREDVLEFVEGLGESLVSGQETPSLVCLDPANGEIRLRQAGRQNTVMGLRPDGTVELTHLESPAEPTLTQRWFSELQQLARLCELEFGCPQDIEWAIEGDRLFLLQARPITTLEAKPRRNVLDEDPGERVLWTRVNIGEAYPGVLTSLTAEFIQGSTKLTPQIQFRRLGVFPKGPVRWPTTPEETPIAIIRGRACANVDYLRDIMDRTPGTSGDAFEEAMLGRAREGLASTPNLRRYPLIIWRIARLFFGIHEEMEDLSSRTDSWWRNEIRRMETASLEEAIAVFDDARDPGSIVTEISVMQGLMAMLSPLVWSPLAAVVRRLGGEEDLLRLSAGLGHLVEAEMMDEMWHVARTGAGREAFIERYGYMGGAGDLSAPSWRMDSDHVDEMFRRIAEAPNHLEVAGRRGHSQQTLEKVEARLRANADVVTRLLLGVALRVYRSFIPLREVGKACLLKFTDVGRAAGHRIGVLLHQRGSIDRPADAQHLSLDRIRAGLETEGLDLRAFVREMKSQRAHYESLAPPESFDGATLREAEIVALAGNEEKVERIAGIPVSAGLCIGRARVVLSPRECEDFRAGDVLVCPATDPSWAPLFSLAGALVVDIGGMLSHASIIARELGVPTVVNTSSGTRRIRDGQWVTVDGGTGVVLLHSGLDHPSGV